MILYKDILDDSHKTLWEPSELVTTPLSEENKAIFDKMVEYVTNSQDDEKAEEYGLRPSVGIAAPQIGINKKMCYCRVPGEEEVAEFFMINPEITQRSAKKCYLGNGEGCLSVKRDTTGYVLRNLGITVKYIDAYTNRKKKVKLVGFKAIVAQHEIDHLNATMYIDKLIPENELPEDAVEI